jgi:class 3 adenylate cyclase
MYVRRVVRVVFRGLRVRMGAHVGCPRLIRDPKTRRVEYIGPVVNAAARITAITNGGQVRRPSRVRVCVCGGACACASARTRLLQLTDGGQPG